MSKYMTIKKDEDEHGLEFHVYSKKPDEASGFEIVSDTIQITGANQQATAYPMQILK